MLVIQLTKTHTRCKQEFFTNLSNLDLTPVMEVEHLKSSG